MNMQDSLSDPLVKAWLIDTLLALVGLVAFIFIVKQVKKSNQKRETQHRESITLKKEIQHAQSEFRDRLD